MHPARWPVGDHPNEMQLSSDGRLFVAEANRNSVSVIDTKTGRLLETLSSALHPGDLPGSMPNSIALSPDGQLCFVANANNNNVAVFNIQERGRAQSLGFIPVGWFPTSVRVTPDGSVLNDIIWHSIKGDKLRMPGPVRAAFFKAHPKRDDDGD